VKPSEIEIAIHRLLDGTLPPEAHPALQTALQNDPAALETYLDCVELDMMLSARVHSAAEEAPSQNPVEVTIRNQQRLALHVSLLAAAALFVLIGVILRLTSVPEKPSILTFRTSPDSVLTLDHSSTSPEVPAPGTLAVGSRVILQQGCLEFSFASGVRSIIKAPANLTLHSESRLHLAEGQAWFHVPKNAVGFQVATRELLVTDLGTEFAIVSNEDAGDEVHVLSGRVHAFNRNGLKQEETLSSGQARIADPAGRMKTIPIRPSGFLTFLPDSLPHLHWSFDGENPLQVEGTLPDFSAITTQAIQSDHRPESARLVVGKRGKALAFDGHGERVQTNWQGFEGRTPRTLACWIKMSPNDPQGWGSIAEWGVGQERENSYWRVRVVPREDRSSTRGILRLGYGMNWIDGETNVADGDWHHIAIVESEASDSLGFPLVRFFVDGKEEDLTYFPRTKAAAPIETRFGEHFSMGRPLPEDIGFRGSIDELFIFEGTLSPASIHRLMSNHEP